MASEDPLVIDARIQGQVPQRRAIDAQDLHVEACDEQDDLPARVGAAQTLKKYLAKQDSPTTKKLLQGQLNRFVDYNNNNKRPHRGIARHRPIEAWRALVEALDLPAGLGRRVGPRVPGLDAQRCGAACLCSAASPTPRCRLCRGGSDSPRLRSADQRGSPSPAAVSSPRSPSWPWSARRRPGTTKHHNTLAETGCSPSWWPAPRTTTYEPSPPAVRSVLSKPSGFPLTNLTVK